MPRRPPDRQIKTDRQSQSHGSHNRGSHNRGDHTPMTNDFHFQLLCPHQELANRRASHVVLCACEGRLGVMAGHEPLVCTLAPGALVQFADGENAASAWFVESGFAEVRPDRLTILAENATPLGELDRAAIEEDIARADGQVRQEGDAARIAAARKRAEIGAAALAALSEYGSLVG